MSGHTVKSYDVEQAELDSRIAQMGGLVESLLWQAFQALDRRDPQLAERAVRGDSAIDQIERDVQARAILLMGRRQPVADDLRHAVSVLAIAADLERVGDLSKSIARRALAISVAEQPRTILHGLKHMTQVAARQLKDVLDAWSTRDAGKAGTVWSADVALDALYSSVFRDVLSWMMDDPRNIEHGMHLLFIAKNLERIGDHTTNIAERIRFVVTGKTMSDERLKSDDTSTYTQPARPQTTSAA